MTTARFRVWDKEQKVWISDYLGFYITPEGKLFHESYEGEDEVLREVHHTLEEVMFSTNLKDKNGMEIYEGDIVNITQYFGGHPYGEIKHIIKRSKYNNNLVADSASGDWRRPEVSMSFRKSDDYEVVGNIHENPELIKE